MSGLVECVPNFSEGRDQGKVALITDAIKAVKDITLLDVDPGQDTNRTVVTFVGPIEAIEEAAFKGIQKAAEVIDMRQQKGAHPRMGATDVCPFVPISNVTIEDCVELSKRVGNRVGEELGIPVYLYENSAKKKERKSLPNIREGEYEALPKKLQKPEWKPDFGPAKFNAGAGATVIGCREFLIAYNINLNTRDTRLATDIAFELREKGRSKRIPHTVSKNLLDGEIIRNKDGSPMKQSGKFKDVKAIGWYMDIYNRAQISINFNNYKSSTIHDVFDEACALATERGVRVTGSELVGLIPLEALLMAGRHYLKKQNRSTGVSEKMIVETAAQSLGLNDVAPFNPNEKIIDYAVRNKTEKHIDVATEEFLEEVGSNSPAPGGGSVSALAGSLGAGLTSMVAALTHEKKDFFDKKPLMEEIGDEAQKIKDRLLFLVEEDTNAFNKVMAAIRLPQSSPEEKTTKAKAVREANIYAIRVPWEVAKLSYRVMELALQLVNEGNPNSVSDVGVAGEVGMAAIRGACLNILINLPGVESDDRFVKDMNTKMDALIPKAEKLQKQILKETINKINS